MLGDGKLSSFRKFVSFRKSLGLPAVGFEKKITSLLRKLEARRDHRERRRGGDSSIKRRPLSMFHFGRELWKLESSTNYNQSSGKERRTQMSRRKVDSKCSS